MLLDLHAIVNTGFGLKEREVESKKQEYFHKFSSCFEFVDNFIKFVGGVEELFCKTFK